MSTLAQYLIQNPEVLELFLVGVGVLGAGGSLAGDRLIAQLTAELGRAQMPPEARQMVDQLRQERQNPPSLPESKDPSGLPYQVYDLPPHPTLDSPGVPETPATETLDLGQLMRDVKALKEQAAHSDPPEEAEATVKKARKPRKSTKPQE